MKPLISILFLILFIHSHAQTKIDSKLTSKENLELSEELVIRAGYAFRFNDYKSALNLYKRAKSLNPANEIIDLLIRTVEKEQKDLKYFENQNQNQNEAESTAIKSLKNEALRILDLNFPFDESNKTLVIGSLANNLHKASDKDCYKILIALDQYSLYKSVYQQIDFSNSIIDDLIFLGERYCSPEEIYSRKFYIIGDDVDHLGIKLEYFITSLNYDPAFMPSLGKIQKLSLNESFISFENELNSKQEVSIIENPVMQDYEIYSSAHPSIISDLILQNEKELNRANSISWKVFAGMVIPGAIGVALTSDDSTKIIFLEDKNGKTQFSNTGKMVDSVSWGLLLGALPTAIAVYPFGKIKSLKRKIDYLKLYLD